MDKKSIMICSFVILLGVVFTLVSAKLTDKSGAIDEKIAAGAESKQLSEDASFKAPEGKYSIKITTIYETEPDTDEKNAPKAKNVAVVVYEYTNADIENGLVISNAHFKAYDKSGNELEQFPQKNLFEPSGVGASGTFTASVAFALNSDDNYIEVDYFNDLASENPDTVYKSEW